MIVHADRMTVNAANSLLKFLEEPHPHTIAILMTEQSQQILPTILSRCQTISFKALSSYQMIETLTSNGVDRFTAPILAQITNNLDEALEYSRNEWFVAIYNTFSVGGDFVLSEHYYSKTQNVESDPKFWSFTLNNYSFRFKTDNGVFSKKEVDFGSRLLIETFTEPAIEGEQMRRAERITGSLMEHCP